MQGGMPPVRPPASMSKATTTGSCGCLVHETPGQLQKSGDVVFHVVMERPDLRQSRASRLSSVSSANVVTDNGCKIIETTMASTSAQAMWLICNAGKQLIFDRFYRGLCLD
jgi:hypothetical protein